MQFEALKVFCDVARLRSFSQAAQANGLSQSAASQAVLQIEKRLGAQLIDRSTRPPHLTVQGRTYYEGCRDLVERYLELESTIRRSHAEKATSVHVAAIYSVGLRDMDQYVQRSERIDPGCEVHIEYLHPDRVYEKVLDGSADLGLLSYPKPSRDLVAISWREEEMVLVCAPGHRLDTADGAIALQQVVGEKYIGFDRHLTIRKKIDGFLKSHRVRMDADLEFDTIENVKHAVELGAGVSFLPLPTVRREIEAHTLVALHLKDARFVRPLAIIHRRKLKLTAAAERFVDLLQQPDQPFATSSATAAARLGRLDTEGQS